MQMYPANRKSQHTNFAQTNGGLTGFDPTGALGMTQVRPQEHSGYLGHRQFQVHLSTQLCMPGICLSGQQTGAWSIRGPEAGGGHAPVSGSAGVPHLNIPGLLLFEEEPLTLLHWVPFCPVPAVQPKCPSLFRGWLCTATSLDQVGSGHWEVVKAFFPCYSYFGGKQLLIHRVSRVGDGRGAAASGNWERIGKGALKGICRLVSGFHVSWGLEVTIFNINCHLRRRNRYTQRRFCLSQNFLFFRHTVGFQRCLFLIFFFCLL